MQSELTDLIERLNEIADEFKSIRRSVPNGSLAWRLADDAVTNAYSASGNAMAMQSMMSWAD